MEQSNDGAEAGRVQVITCPVGEARQRLKELLAEFKAADPLAPVTVVVPSNQVGLDVRRALARESALVNVRFLVVERAAELVAAGRLNAQGLRPRSKWRWLETLREAAVAERGRLAAVAEHPATLRRLAGAAADLRAAGEDVLRAIEESGDALAAETVRVVRRAEAEAADSYDDHRLVEEAAAALLEGAAAGRELGALVLYLPERLTAATATFVREAASGPGAAAILGLTGDPEADLRVERWRAMLADDGTAPRAWPPTPILPGRVASLPDSEEEVRYAVREAWRLAEAGVPLHWMAILYGNADQYRALVHELLTALGLPHNGPGVRKLSDSLAGRTVLGALRAARTNFRRDAVIDWLGSAPVQWAGREVPAHRWDAVTRDAGVTREVNRWRQALEAHCARQERLAAEGRLDEDEAARRCDAARDIASFIKDAAARLGQAERESIGEHARRAGAALEHWLPRAALETRAGVPEEELKAWDEVRRVLGAMEEAGAGGTRVSPAAFEAALREALGAPMARHGRIGEGVFVGSVAEAAGMEFEAAWVLGLGERIYPLQEGDDPLLPERLRARFADVVPSAAERRLAERRAYLAVVAGSRKCTVTMPRASLRDQRPVQPSRWLLEAATALAGQPVYASDLEKMVDGRAERPGWLEVVDSFESAIRAGDAWASSDERDLTELVRAGAAPWEHPLSSEDGLREGMLARAARSAGSRMPAPAGVGAYTGEAGQSTGTGEDARPVSATAMETLVSCPFRYFLRYELGVREVERPEELDVIEAAEQGSLVHLALERFVREVMERRGQQELVGTWSDDERRLLFAIAEELFEDAERRGITGRQGAWLARKERIRHDLERFLEEDERERGDRWAVVAAELEFGSEEGRAVQVTLPSGRVIAFRGKADRVDQCGDRLRVFDYKTGKADRFKRADQGGRVLRTKEGEWLLQLPVYALAAREHEGQPVEAAYWFITEDGKFAMETVDLGAAWPEFVKVLDAGTALREQGVFPAVPGAEARDSWKHCTFCPYDPVCPGSERDRFAERLLQDERLATFRSVVLGDDTGEEAEE
ncbi:PD-(D/E)XK nuclease family protein [Tepidiforma sp.]|uniref:PD-(D/E)XK nuclease family protein n=1 Tax=Tepidiforma sp. TaxID=2682230 RepID=UPI002ADE3F14|nr:PD-(D/E)XK nuclease family protein [Tepidiforma sp.]